MIEISYTNKQQPPLLNDRYIHFCTQEKTLRRKENSVTNFQYVN